MRPKKTDLILIVDGKIIKTKRKDLLTAVKAVIKSGLPADGELTWLNVNAKLEYTEEFRAPKAVFKITDTLWQKHQCLPIQIEHQEIMLPVQLIYNCLSYSTKSDEDVITLKTEATEPALCA